MSEFKFNYQNSDTTVGANQTASAYSATYAPSAKADDTPILIMLLVLVLISSGAMVYGWREYRAMQRKLTRVLTQNLTYEKENDDLKSQNNILRRQLNTLIEEKRKAEELAAQTAAQTQWAGKSDNELYRSAYDMITKERRYDEGIQLTQYVLRQFPNTMLRDHCQKLIAYAQALQSKSTP